MTIRDPWPWQCRHRYGPSVDGSVDGDYCRLERVPGSLYCHLHEPEPNYQGTGGEQ